MELVKGDKVKHLDQEGTIVSVMYNHVVEKQKYIDVYFKDLKQVKTVKVNELEKID